MKTHFRKRILLVLFLFSLSISAALSITKKETRVNTAISDPFVNSKSKQSYILTYDTPAPLDIVGWETQSLPLGNGYFGVSFFGGVEEELLQFSEKSVWQKNDDPSSSKSNPLGLSGLCELRLIMDHSTKNVSQYKRTLNLNKALGEVDYTTDGVGYKRELLTSYPDHVLAVRLTASRKGKISFKLKGLHEYLCDFRKGSAEVQGQTLLLKGMTEPFKLKYEVAIRVVIKGGRSSVNATAETGEFTVSGADEALVLVSLGTNYQLNPQVFLQAKSELKLDGYSVNSKLINDNLDLAEKMGWEKLLERHEKDYCALFNRATLDLGGKPSALTTNELLKLKDNTTPEFHHLEETFFQYGRYLLISASRAGTLPAHLQGIWNMHKCAPWQGNYTADENIEMAYWPAFVTNLEETFPPYSDFFLASFAQGQQQATNALLKYQSNRYDAKSAMINGWTIANSTPYNLSMPSVWSSVGIAPYVLQLFWDWYKFTDDKAVLEKAWPILLASSRFLSAYLVEQSDGKLLCDPSWSSENPERRAGIKGNVKDYPLGSNRVCLPGTSQDQQMVYENFRIVINAAKILGKNDPILAKLQAQLQNLDPVLIGTSGQIKEFRQEDAYGSIGDPNHRHISHLLSLYPYTLLTEKKEWLEGCKVTLNGRGDKSTGWATAHKINMWARIKDGERAYKLFLNLISNSTLPNLWNTCPPFQFDGSAGGAAGVAEMLLQSHEGFIELLPALPKGWEKGSFNGLRARGAFEVSASWESGHLKNILVQSLKGSICKMHLRKGWKVFQGENSPVKVSYDEKTELLSFETRAGESYVFRE